MLAVSGNIFSREERAELQTLLAPSAIYVSASSMQMENRSNLR